MSSLSTRAGLGRPGRPLASSLLAVALCSAVLAASTTPAGAQSRSDEDATGDMFVLEGRTYAPAPDRISNDVLRTTLTHGPRRLRVVVEYADLTKVGWQGLYVQVNTDERVRRNVFLDIEPPRWGGVVWMINGGITTVRCPIRHQVDYDTDRMTLSFPRTCASNPRWVRFSVAAIAEDGDLIYFDDALSDVPDDDQNWTASARIHR